MRTTLSLLALIAISVTVGCEAPGGGPWTQSQRRQAQSDKGLQDLRDMRRDLESIKRNGGLDGDPSTPR